MSMTSRDSQPELATRLRGVHVGLREDLEVSRHVFRGEPCYIVRDPITFQSHRLSPADYRILVSIDNSHTLGETFAGLIEQSVLDDSDEEMFFQFVFMLHRLGFLSLPVADDRLLYKRYVARKAARRKQRLLGFLFIQVPLFNPDAFLTHTLPVVRWVYTWGFFLLWLALVGAAGYVVATNWSELVQPIHGLLVARNLPLMWITLILLKVCHEFGHAYACKRFGGHVPEMGAYLIALTPCAYVDATSAWGFARKRQRLFVSLAGVYVELTIAAIAVFVWSLTGPSLLNAAAYNVIFLASAATLLFNINPLMRYDGYYVLSDLLEIPNLRQRSTQYVLGIIKRWLLGVRDTAAPAGLKLRLILGTFGVTATAYRALVLVGIAAIVASKFFALGLALAGLFLGTTVFTIVRRVTKYLWMAEETAPVRFRAVAVSALLLVGIPAALGLLPVPTRVNAAGSVVREHEAVVRAAVPGFLESVEFERGQEVRSGELLARLENLTLDEHVAETRANVDASRIRLDALEFSDPALAQQETQRSRFQQRELDHTLARQADLRITAPAAGRVVDGIRARDAGRFVEAGDPIAAIIWGGWQVRAVLTAEQVSDAEPSVGDRVRFRAADQTEITLSGTITRINPVGSRWVDLPSLTHLAGGDVVVEPVTGEATQPYFELVISFEQTLPPEALRYGMTGVVQLPAAAEPIAVRGYRRFARFMNTLLKS